MDRDETKIKKAIFVWYLFKYVIVQSTNRGGGGKEAAILGSIYYHEMNHG